MLTFRKVSTTYSDPACDDPCVYCGAPVAGYGDDDRQTYYLLSSGETACSRRCAQAESDRDDHDRASWDRSRAHFA